MPPELISVLIQLPAVAAFVYFVLQSDKNRRDSIHRNHDEWRTWLTNQNELFRNTITQLNQVVITAMNTNAQLYIAETNRFTQSIAGLDTQVSRLTTIALLNYAAINGRQAESQSLKDELVQNLQEKL